MASLISFSAEAFSSLVVELDGTSYVLGLKYHARANRYSLDLGDRDGNPIVADIPILLGADLLRPYRYDDRVPKGALLAFGPSLSENEIGLGELDRGARGTLVYLTAVEIATVP